jgi:hypothetical protein
LTTCLNCGASFEGKFCPDCGQNADVKRLTMPVLVEELLHFFTHLERGFLFTSWGLVVRPGKISLDYLQGKRKKYQKPVSYFLIWTGIYIILHNFIVNQFHFQVTSSIIAETNLREQANLLLRKHFTAFLLPLIFTASILIYYVMAKPRLTYAEVLALSVFGGGTYFMLLLASDLVLGTIFRIDILSTRVFLWQAILSSAYNFWFSYDLFKKIAIPYFWVRLIVVSLLIALIGWAVLEYFPMALVMLKL